MTFDIKAYLLDRKTIYRDPRLDPMFPHHIELLARRLQAAGVTNRAGVDDYLSVIPLDNPVRFLMDGPAVARVEQAKPDPTARARISDEHWSRMTPEEKLQAVYDRPGDPRGSAVPKRLSVAVDPKIAAMTPQQKLAHANEKIAEKRGGK